eukprot:5154831-Amphidinium_carterae.2
MAFLSITIRPCSTRHQQGISRKNCHNMQRLMGVWRADELQELERARHACTQKSPKPSQATC